MRCPRPEVEDGGRGAARCARGPSRRRLWANASVTGARISHAARAPFSLLPSSSRRLVDAQRCLNRSARGLKVGQAIAPYRDGEIWAGAGPLPRIQGKCMVRGTYLLYIYVELSHEDLNSLQAHGYGLETRWIIDIRAKSIRRTGRR